MRGGGGWAIGGIKEGGAGREREEVRGEGEGGEKTITTSPTSFLQSEILLAHF